QEENRDGSGSGDLERFRLNCTAHLGTDRRILPLASDSLRLSPEDLGGTEGRRFRMFSIDGGHTPGHVLNDLALAEAVLDERGFVVVDDFYNPAWPGVNEGIHRYWFSGGRLRPFAYGGNKLFLCRPGAWEFWYGEASRMAPHATRRRIVRLVGTPALQFELEPPSQAFRLRAETVPSSQERFSLQTAILSREPNVLAFMSDAWGACVRFADGSTSLDALCRSVGPGGHLFLTVAWSLLDHDAWGSKLAEMKRVLEAHPGVTLIFLCNEPDELGIPRRHGFGAELVPHNALVDDAILGIAGDDRPFDAIYNARFAPFKRHELASRVPRLALVYGDSPELRPRWALVREQLPGAQYLSGDPFAGTHRPFSLAQIAASLNQAKVGLCLSAVEGGMFASIEYLLCGLPVVSTPSRGGRDLFFDDRYCLVAEPEPRAIADAVARLIARDVPREEIRSATLERMVPFRRRLVELVDGIRQAAGKQPEGEGLLRRLMTSPWHIWTWRGLAALDAHYQRGEAA
ncbi:MAG TPA: glycosyltransferase, partial [Stellaceae bacterium]|nr:glycosyltransferase [Stellaceae bacterium]